MYKRVRGVCAFMLAAVMVIATMGEAMAQDAIDWAKGTVTVVGMGIAPPDAVNAAQARMLARRAAVADGYRQLAESIKGVNVDAESTVERMMTVSDVVNTKVSACIKGAQVVAEQITPDGGYEVTMVVPIYGVSNSLAEAVLTKPAAKIPFPSPTPNVAPTPATTVHVQVNITQNTPTQPAQTYTHQSTSFAGMRIALNSYNASVLPVAFPWPASTSNTTSQGYPPASQQTAGTSRSADVTSSLAEVAGDYTGLVIDCTGLGLQPAMSPVIQNESGEAIYGAKNLDYDLVISKGMASYVKSLDQLADVSRTGDKPLVVKGTALARNNINPVISVADANRILLENEQSHFLDKLNVVFLR